MTGFDRIIGIEEAERTPRTRMGLIQIEERLAGTDGLDGNKFGLKSVERVAMKSRVLLGEEWRDGAVQVCDVAEAAGGTLLGSNGPVNVSGACDPLREWDLTDRLDSPGAILFRRFGVRLRANFRCLPTGLQGSTCPGQESVYATPYSNSDPVHTPAGLNVTNPLVQKALADAVSDLNGASIPFDGELRDFQTEERGGEAIPIPGGPDSLGVFNVISASFRPDDGGYTNVPHGGSFIMAAEFTGKKCPVRADTFVTYGQSENQDSPHSKDYTKAFSEGDWNRAPFCGADVKRETLERSVVRIAGRR